MKPSKIEKLTAQQEAELVAFRATWLAHGLSSERADRPRAQAAITRMYELIGKRPPAFLWFDSPMSASLAIALLQKIKEQPSSLRAQLRDQLRDQLWAQLRDQLGAQLVDQLRDQLRDQLGAQLRDQLRDQLGAQLRDQLGAQLRDQLGAQLGDQLRAQLGDQLWDQLRDQLRAQLGDQLRDQLVDQLGDRARRAATQEAFWGQHEASWIVFYLFAQHVGAKFSEEQSARLQLWAELAQSCGWWLPYDGLCVMCERPESVSFDERRRLHRQDGPALAFRDGYRVFAWHGMRVPENWITAPEALDPKTALTWQNIEQRRAAAEIIGWKRVLEQLSPRVINKHKDPEIGELLEVELPEAGTARFLKVRCGTGRDFVLSVPREMKTALEANAWTYDLKPKDYKLEART